MRDVYRERFQGGVMNCRKRILRWLAGLFIPVIMLSACALNKVNFTKVTPLSAKSMVIYAAMTRNYIGAHGELSIYVDTNGFPGQFTPTSEGEKTELTATLWLVIADRPETYTSFQVQSGQTIPFEGYDIKILRIAEYDRGAYFVEVEVSEVE
jgi:hypothetical protein